MSSRCLHGILTFYQCKSKQTVPASQNLAPADETVTNFWWSQCRGHGFDPWSRKIPHASEQLGKCRTTNDRAWVLQLLKPGCPRAQGSPRREAVTMRSRHNEKPASSTNSSPCSRQLGKQSQQWRPCAAKEEKLLILILVNLTDNHHFFSFSWHLTAS